MLGKDPGTGGVNNRVLENGRHLQMREALRFGLAIALGGAALAGSRPAAAMPPATIYGGQEAASIGLQLKSWGSGMVSEDRTRGYAGQPVSIKIKTEGYYSGGRLVFGQPKDLTPQFTAPDSKFGFIDFTLQFQQGSGNTGSAQPPMEGEKVEGQSPQNSKFVRITLVFDGGAVAEVVNQPIVLYPATGGGGMWWSMAVPFPAFKGLDKIQKYVLREMRIFTDRKDEMFIGEIKTITDDEPISIEPLDNLEVSVNDVVQFDAKATAGISTLKFSWDFDASDGIQEDATGPTVTHVYKKPSKQTAGGDPIPYVVTLTVTDVSGAKKTEVRKVEVIVN
jgi:hypothetical protein